MEESQAVIKQQNKTLNCKKSSNQCYLDQLSPKVETGDEHQKLVGLDYLEAVGMKKSSKIKHSLNKSLLIQLQ
jgi:hypothetical protein